MLDRPGPRILGVRTTTQVDKAYEDGLLVEKTFDYFAQDRRGNVWYMGEDVTNFHYGEDGKLIGKDHELAWRAGRRGEQYVVEAPARAPATLLWGRGRTTTATPSPDPSPQGGGEYDTTKAWVAAGRFPSPGTGEGGERKRAGWGLSADAGAMPA